MLSFPSSTRVGIKKLLKFHLDFILQKAKRRSYGSNPISLKAFQVQVKNYCFHFACKVEKFKNQLKFCNQILERHNFVHLIKLFRTTRGKHLFKLLKYKIFSLKRQDRQNSAEPPLNRYERKKVLNTINTKFLQDENINICICRVSQKKVSQQPSVVAVYCLTFSGTPCM